MAYRVAVVGAAGYAGVELVRRIVEHPSFELSVITSDADAGSRLDAVYPAFTGVTDIVFSPHADPSLLDCDIAFLAVPHTASLAQTPALIDAGVTVIDLSADYRLKDPAIAAAAARHAAGQAVLVACAGCFPTATSLAAYPAVHAGLIEGVLNVQAISGVTGAGKKPTARTHFCAAAGNAEAYGVLKHRHTPEIEQILGLAGRVVFVPHLVPMRRGLLSTVTMQVPAEAASGMTPEAATALYKEFYAGRPFVQVLEGGAMPRTDSVAGSNRAQVGVTYHADTRTLIAVAAIDNLGKGAADQAVQCANIVCGLPETCGLTSLSLPV